MLRIERMTRDQVCKVLLVVCLVAGAIVIRYIDGNYYRTNYLTMARTMIYITLFTAWGVSVHRRVIQPQLRKYLVAISVFIVYWMFVRTVKYCIALNPLELRMLWYQYYIPMLMIPLLAVLLALSLGKTEHYRLPVGWNILFVPTAAFIVLVLTNDFHQLVFRFEEGKPMLDDYSTHEVGYLIILGWIILCAFVAIGIMIRKCHAPNPGKIRFLPLIPIVVTILYAILFYTGNHFINTYIPDVTVVYCLFFMVVFESCMMSGLIPTNSGYTTLFRASGISARITDCNYHVQYAAARTIEVEKSQMRKAKDGPVRIDSKTLLRSAPIQNGYIIWTEDVEEVEQVIEELEEAKETLAEHNYLERQNYETEKKIHQLREQNRLLSKIQIKTASQTESLYRLFEEYEKETDENKKRQILAKTAVLGAYIKRQGNLYFLSEQNPGMDSNEFYLALNETVANLELLGVEGGIFVEEGLLLDTKQVIAAYEHLERVIECLLDEIAAIYIRLKKAAEGVQLIVMIETPLQDERVKQMAHRSVYEDGQWTLVFYMDEGGAEHD
ncbi:MAG: hypothetical protein K6G01_09710 [Eubacterium sp.]|nr:hypothetical protein [Eubacterium sp.]